MFTDLAVIDWIALVFAALLLSAAAAAAVIAYVTSSRRPKRAASTSGRASRPQHAARAQPKSAASASLHSMPNSPVVDESVTAAHGAQGLATAADVVTNRPNLDTDERVAARAAKLRRAPIAETRGPVVQSPALTATTNRLPAHARSLSTAPGTSASVVESFDTVAGFKARNPGFFDDPMGRHELRYWDGHAWTEYVKEHGERFTDPL